MLHVWSPYPAFVMDAKAKARLHSAPAHRYAILMAPVRGELDALCRATVSRTPETPHEAAFAKDFARPLSEAVAAIAQPPPAAWFDFRRAAAAFEPLRKLLALVEARARCAP